MNAVRTRLTEWLQDAMARMERSQRRRLTKGELYSLDDHVLEDIGLRRSNIDEVVEKMFPNMAPDLRAVTVTPPTVKEANDAHHDQAA